MLSFNQLHLRREVHLRLEVILRASTLRLNNSLIWLKKKTQRKLLKLIFFRHCVGLWKNKDKLKSG